MIKSDVLIIGAGAVGSALARELSKDKFQSQMTKSAVIYQNNYIILPPIYKYKIQLRKYEKQFENPLLEIIGIPQASSTTRKIFNIY